MSRERAARTRTAATVLAAAALVLFAAGAVGLYLARLDLARRAAVSWLKSLGVQGEVQIQALGPTGLKARVRIGPPDRPDLTVEQADVSYSLESFLRGQGLKVSTVRLYHPVLRAGMTGGRLDLGSLDRLAQATKPGAGEPSSPAPRIEVRSGLLRLKTDYGPADIAGDADVSQGRLDRLDVALAPTTLRLGGATAALRGATLKALRSGERLTLGAQARVSDVRLADVAGSDAALALQGELAYGPLLAGRVQGRLSAQGRLASAAAGGMAARGLSLDLQAPALTAALEGRTGQGRFHLRLGAASLRQADLRVSGLSSDSVGSLSLDRTGALRLMLAGALSGQGAWPALGAMETDDAPVIAAAKRSLSGFQFGVGKAALSLDHGHWSARLVSPATVRASSGAALNLRPADRGYTLTLAGGGLPQTEVDVRRLDLGAGALAADLRLTTAFSFGLLDQATVKADGRLTVRGAQTRFTAAACADLSVKKLDFGDNSALDFIAKLCPSRAPLLTVSPGRWSMAGQAREVSARVPAFEAGLSQGAGAIRLQGQGQSVAGAFTVDQATATDLAKPLRFHPVTASGQAVLAHNLFSGRADVRTPKGARIAHAEFRHQVEAMAGGMTISVPALTFAKGGLQPTDLSPLTTVLGEPASGRIDFEGRFDWSGDTMSSSGRLTAQNLSFRSPAGPVTGLSGAMAFTSLAPLVGATVGPIRADRLAAIVPLADVSARAAIDKDVATVTDGQGSVGGGRARLNATASLAGDQAVKGELVVDKVQVRDLVASSPFSDKVSLTAEISGRIPFQMTAGKLRVAGGSARADGPGRLSINRATFNPGGAAKGPATEDNLSTFGYQAMENLAFQTLDATIGSQPDGKLRLVFHVIGKHDPLFKKELRLTWRDFFDRKVLNKSMPLPSNTGVNLTLDTTLNLDNLIRSQGALDRQFGSGSVQPSDATLASDTAERCQ